MAATAGAAERYRPMTVCSSVRVQPGHGPGPNLLASNFNRAWGNVRMTYAETMPMSMLRTCTV